jgi:hypothetical protein
MIKRISSQPSPAMTYHKSEREQKQTIEITQRKEIASKLKKLPK